MPPGGGPRVYSVPSATTLVSSPVPRPVPGVSAPYVILLKLFRMPSEGLCECGGVHTYNVVLNRKLKEISEAAFSLLAVIFAHPA